MSKFRVVRNQSSMFGYFVEEYCVGSWLAKAFTFTRWGALRALKRYEAGIVIVVESNKEGR